MQGALLAPCHMAPLRLGGSSPYAGMDRTEALWEGQSQHEGHHPTQIFTPFAPEEYELRMAAVRSEMRQRQLDALVLTEPVSIYHLTNYQTPGNPFTALVVPLGDAEPCLFTRELEGTNVIYRCTVRYRLFYEGQQPETDVAKFVASLPQAHRRVGYEGGSSRLTVANQKALEAALAATADVSPSRQPDEWVEANEVLLVMRTIKSEQEVACMRRAASYSLAGLRAAVAAIKPGATEAQVAVSAAAAIDATKQREL